MKEFFKQNAKILCVVLFVMLTLPVVILTPSPIGFIPQEIGLTIVEYGGSIIGGFLTLYGVWWTIDDSKTTRQKDLELQYCPVLSAEIIHPREKIRNLCSEILVMYDHPGFDDTNVVYTAEVIRLKNVGRGEIKRIELNLNECSMLATSERSVAQEIAIDKSYILCDGVFDFIPIGGVCHFLVGMPAIRDEFLKSIDNHYYERISITIDIFVQGVFTTEEQEYTLHFYLNRSVEYEGRRYELNTLSFMKR